MPRTAAGEPSLWDLRALYSLSGPRLARLLDTSPTTLYRHLYDADGNPIAATRAKKLPDTPEGSVFLVWMGLRIPVRRDHNGDLIFNGPEVEAIFTGNGRRLHPANGT